MITRLIGSEVPDVGQTSSPVTINLQNTWFQVISAATRRSTRMIVSIKPVTDGAVFNITIGKGGAGSEVALFVIQIGGSTDQTPINPQIDIEIGAGERVAVKSDFASAPTYNSVVTITLLGRS